MKKNLLKPMLLAFALLAGAVSAWADGGEVWIKTLPKDLQNNDQVVIVDLTKKLAVINNPDEGSAPPAASIKLNDRLDRIAEDAVGDTVKWTVEVQGSGDNRTYKFKTGKKYLTVINKDNGLSVGGDGEKSFKTVQDDGNKRAQFFYTVVKDTTRIMGMYSMMSISNNWRTKMSIDDQIKGTVTAIFRKSDPTKNDVVLSFLNGNGEEDYNYETDLKNGANNFVAPTLTGLPSGATAQYFSTNEKVAKVDASTGKITLRRRGTTDITVVYQGDSKNNYALATYTLRVDDGNDTSGTSDYPFTVGEAIQYAKDGNGSVGYNYFVKGIICKVESSNYGAAGGVSIPGLTDSSVEGTLTYWISDSGVMKDSLKVSTGRGLNWGDLTADSISVGDEVLVVGPMSYCSSSSMMSFGSNKDSVAVIDADNCMQTLVRKLVVADTKLYLGTHRDGTELYSIEGAIPGKLGDPTIEVKDTTVARVNSDGWLVTEATGKTKVTLSVPVTVAEGTYTMSRSFSLKVTTTDAEEGHFVLVEDASTLQAGDSLLIVATMKDKSYVISSEDGKMSGKEAVEVRIGDNGTIDEVPDDVTAITLRGEAGKWNLSTSAISYFYTSAKKPGASSFSIPGMGEGTGTGTGTGEGTGTGTGTGSGGGTGGFDLESLFGGGDTNKLRHDTIPGTPGDSAQVKIAIDKDAFATITFRGDSILRYTEEMDLAGMLGSFGGSGEGGSSSSIDPSVLEGLDISMPAFEVFHPDTVPGTLPKIYRFERYDGLQTFDYYVAEFDESEGTLTFKGTNTAPDEVTTWDATNTGDKPAWYNYAKQIKHAVIDETFAAARPTSCARWFYDTTEMLSSVSGLKHLNTSEVTTMRGMFYRAGDRLWGVSTLDLSTFNTSKVADMGYMFEGSSVSTIYVGIGWDVSNVTNSKDMFWACSRLRGQYGAGIYYNNIVDQTRANFDKEDGLLCFSGLIIKDDEDNSEALEQYNGKAVNVFCDRVLKADKNEDETWNSRAYSICLPFDIDLTELRDADKIQTCWLYYIKDNKEFMFSNVSPKLVAGRPYIIVVKEGNVRLGVNNATIVNDEPTGYPVYKWGDTDVDANSIGVWKGTFKKIESADAAAMYAYGLWNWKGTPYYMRVRPDTPDAWIEQFRGMFIPNEPTGNNTYSLSYKQWIAGDEEDDPIVDFPASNFDADEFPGEVTGISTPSIRTIENDGKHTYYDLQGRQLTVPAAKGIYIDNGKKVIK